MILWARHGLRVGGGPDGAPGETTRPTCCEMAPQGETIRARARWQPFFMMRMSSLWPARSNPLPCCLFLTGPWEEENGRARGAQSLSEKKAIRERREARLKLSQWEQSVPLSTASAWDFPKHDTHSAWVSSACRGDLHASRKRLQLKRKKKKGSFFPYKRLRRSTSEISKGNTIQSS